MKVHRAESGARLKPGSTEPEPDRVSAVTEAVTVAG
jgi:hypothetical protein